MAAWLTTTVAVRALEQGEHLGAGLNFSFNFIEQMRQWMPLEARQLLLVLGASLLIGLAMESRKLAGSQSVTPGGVRTMPLISLTGFLLCLLGSRPWGLAAFIAGLLVLGAWLTLMYRAKISTGKFGMTTEVYALVTYILGGLVAAEQWWLAGAITVVLVMIQELKHPLERLAARVSEEELITVSKFLLLTAVILPLVPNESAGWLFGLNPRNIWLVVVAVAGISYLSYVIAKLTRRRGGSLLLTGILGGGYSSTVTTIVLARRSRRGDLGDGPAATAAAMLAASGMMYVRLLVLVGLFSRPLLEALLLPFAISAAVGLLAAAAIVLSRRPAPADAGGPAATAPPNGSPAASPLELRTAFTFAAIFVAILLLIRLAGQRLGETGLFALAGLSGLGVVDPFVLGLTQGSANVGLATAGLAVVIAACANNLAKGFYAAALAEPRTGRWALGMLIGLTAVTVGAWIACYNTGFVIP
ncbi:MAG: hypothetical protein BIFFINMI_02232 [Phycisphaerae bacterium]|nr:hypothetical protein [Phycisphaerae bacterium]